MNAERAHWMCRCGHEFAAHTPTVPAGLRATGDTTAYLCVGDGDPDKPCDRFGHRFVRVDQLAGHAAAYRRATRPFDQLSDADRAELAADAGHPGNLPSR